MEGHRPWCGPPEAGDLKYPLKKDQGYFWTGAAPDGRQFIIANTVTEIYALSFGRDGAYLGMEGVPLRRPAVRDRSTGIYVTDNDYDRGVERQFDEIRNRLHCRASDILIEAFDEPEAFAGIDLLPGEYQELFDRPEAIEEADRTDLEEVIRAWRESGWFVLVLWGIDYWMSAEGEVMSH